MSYKHLLVFAGASTYFAYLLQLSLLLFSFLIVHSKIPLTSIKLALMGWNFLIAVTLSPFVFSSPVSVFVCFGICLVLLVAPALKRHLDKRTTASYSTSDSQTQRFFNVTLFLYVISVFGILLLRVLGVNMPPSFLGFLFVSGAGEFPYLTAFVPGLILLVWDAALCFKHARTLLYVLKSHSRSFFQGKLKRFW